MLTGHITIHKEPTTTTYYNQEGYDEFFNYSNDNETWSQQYNRLEEARKAAIAAGFTIGVRVTRSYGSTLEEGVVHGFEPTIQKGMSALGKPQPIIVLWGGSQKAIQYTACYSVDELKLVPKDTENAYQTSHQNAF